MARLPRFFVEGMPQHIVQRGNNRDVVFASAEDYLFYLECLGGAVERHGMRIHAYVLMTNHVHLLVTPDHEGSLSGAMQSVGRRYVQFFNHHYRRTGTLWEGRYRATLIDSTEEMGSKKWGQTRFKGGRNGVRLDFIPSRTSRLSRI